MKVILKNSNLVFQTSHTEQVTMRFGNEVSGMELSSYLKSDGGVQPVSSAQYYAVTPFINIEGVVSNIDITYVFSAYVDKVIVAFYSENSDASFISAILRQEGQAQGLPSLQILLENIPSTAKYLRFVAWHGTEHDSTAANASVLSFVRQTD
jgi:hypothetical protein